MFVEPFLDERHTMTLEYDKQFAGVGTEPFVELAQWKVLGIRGTGRPHAIGSTGKEISELEIDVVVQRRYWYYIWKVDNDAERVARAGLAIIEAVAKLNEQTRRPRLATRVGIHSGVVVVGAGAGKDADVDGDALRREAHESCTTGIPHHPFRDAPRYPRVCRVV